MNPFQLAKDEGYSDDEIIDYLKGHSDYSDKISSALSEGYSPQEISSFLGSRKKPKKTTADNVERYASDVISGVAGVPHALTHLPDFLINQAKSLYSDEEESVTEDLDKYLNYVSSTLNPVKSGITSILNKFMPESEVTKIYEQIPGSIPELAVKLRQALPSSEEVREKLTDQEIDTLDRYIMAASAGAPFGPGGALVGAGIQAGEDVLEASGASPRTKAATRLLALGATGLKGKKGLQAANAEESAILKLGRKAGMTDAEIAPALSEPSTFKKWLAKAAKKGGKAEAVLEMTGEGLGSIYENLKNEHEASQKVLAIPERQNMQSQLSEVLDSLPAKHKQFINQDIQDFHNSPQSASDMINLYQKISKTFDGDKAALQRLKGPIIEAMETVDPNLARDFQTVNKAWANYASVRNIMNPKEMGWMGHLKHPASLIATFLTGNPFLLAKGYALAHGVSFLAREMVMNPKLKNISKKIAYGINKKSYGAISVGIRELAKEVEKDDPELAEEIRKVKPKDLIPK